MKFASKNVAVLATAQTLRLANRATVIAIAINGLAGCALAADRRSGGLPA